MVKISVIMPAYNDAQYIAFAINSVRAQTFQDWELIVVDDGSTDNSADIADEYAAKDSRIRVIRQKNQGVIAARNNAIAVARGEFIYPLDSDDRIASNCLDVMYNKITTSDYAVIAPGTVRFGRYNSIDLPPAPTKKNMYIRSIIVVTSLFRKSDWEANGGFDPDFKDGNEDHAFWLKFLTNGQKIYRTKERLFFYRIKPEQQSRQKQSEPKVKEIYSIMYQKFPMMPIYRKLHNIRKFIISIKPTKKLYIIRFMKIPIFVLPRIKSTHHIDLYYFNNRPNFGDMLNIAIPQDIFGYEARKAGKSKAEAVFIGSVLQDFLYKKANIGRALGKFFRRPIKVWGAGLIKPEVDGYTKLSRRMDVSALRGELTLDRMRKYTGKPLDNVVLGDPGLLASRLITPDVIYKKYDLGIIPHYVDKDSDLLDKIKVENAIVINPDMQVYDFLEMVASCKNIISSAMHGLIAADSLGIPNVRMILSDDVVGGDYKFDDYYSVFGIGKHNKIDLREVKEFSDLESIKKNYKISPTQVDKICEDLLAVFPYKNRKNK